MSEPPAAKLRVKRGTAQQHLLNSAQQLFGDKGYRGTTTKDIAQHTGVSENLLDDFNISLADKLCGEGMPEVMRITGTFYRVDRMSFEYLMKVFCAESFI